MNTPKIDELQMDAFRELINIGSGKAAKALGQMTSQTIEISIPKIRTTSMAKTTEVLGAGTEVYAIHVRMLGGFRGRILLCLPLVSACKLCGLLLGQEPAPDQDLPDMAESALKEVGNILGAGVVNVLSDIMHVTTFITVPSVTRNTMEAIVKFVLDAAALKGDCLLAETNFSTSAQGFTGQLLVLPEAQDFEALLKKLPY